MINVFELSVDVLGIMFSVDVDVFGVTMDETVVPTGVRLLPDTSNDVSVLVFGIVPARRALDEDEDDSDEYEDEDVCGCRLLCLL